MPLEIEVKLRMDNLNEARRRLGELNALCKGLTRETNLFFDRPDRSLLERNSGLRVRMERRDDGSAKGLLTYKGPPGETGLHSREAFDVYCDPPEQVEPLLAALGFVRTLSYDKRRESWEYRECKVELDELPRLGTFLEIEGPTEEAVRNVQKELGLEAAPAMRESYVAMVDAHLKHEGSKDRHLGF